MLEKGVQQNNRLMLSLTTINNEPVQPSLEEAKQDGGNDYGDDLLVYEPSEAQVYEINNMLQLQKRHPIMVMREKSRLSNSSPQDGRSSPTSRQVIRSITFFNSKQAQMDKDKEMREQRQVFKLSASVERLTSLQPIFDQSVRFLQHGTSSTANYYTLVANASNKRNHD